MKALRFLVAGAGYSGSRLLQQLPAEATAGIRRQAADGPPRIIAADFDMPLPPLPAAETIIYTVPPSSNDAGDPRLQRFLAALAATPARIVYFSTSGVYGDTGGATIDESAPVNPRTRRAERRVAAESILADYCDTHSVERCVLRVPGIYGPGRLGLARLRNKEPVLRDADAGPGNRIHVDDLVRSALAAARNASVPRICNVGDGDPMTSGAFSRAVAEVAGLPAPPELTWSEAEQQFSERRLSFLRASRCLDLARMLDELQVLPRYADPREGIRASLEEAG